jgi:hypothetical protein
MAVHPSEAEAEANHKHNAAIGCYSGIYDVFSSTLRVISIVVRHRVCCVYGLCLCLYLYRVLGHDHNDDYYNSHSCFDYVEFVSDCFGW